MQASLVCEKSLSEKLTGSVGTRDEIIAQETTHKEGRTPALGLKPGPFQSELLNKKFNLPLIKSIK